MHEHVIGWIANAFVIAGWWAMARQRRWAPLATAIGSLLWCAVGLLISLPSMAAIEAICVGLGLRTWWRWRTDRGKPAS